MSSRSARCHPFPLLGAVLVLAFAGCSDPVDEGDAPDALSAAVDVESTRAGDAGRARSGEVRRERFESRIGPQPWPTDLPEGWPTPDAATVLADTRRGEGGRLLLVDLPAAPDRALDDYREALGRAGFATQRPRDPKLDNALHVHRGDEQAVLTFRRHAGATRLEIFFLAAAPG